MAVRSRRSVAWAALISVAVLILAVVAWLLFVGQASTPTLGAANLDVSAPTLPAPVEPPTVPSPPQPPAPTG